MVFHQRFCIGIGSFCDCLFHFNNLDQIGGNMSGDDLFEFMAFVIAVAAVTVLPVYWLLWLFCGGGK